MKPKVKIYRLRLDERTSDRLLALEEQTALERSVIVRALLHAAIRHFDEHGSLQVPIRLKSPLEPQKN